MLSREGDPAEKSEFENRPVLFCAKIVLVWKNENQTPDLDYSRTTAATHTIHWLLLPPPRQSLWLMAFSLLLIEPPDFPRGIFRGQVFSSLRSIRNVSRTGSPAPFGPQAAAAVVFVGGGKFQGHSTLLLIRKPPRVPLLCKAVEGTPLMSSSRIAWGLAIKMCGTKEVIKRGDTVLSDTPW